MFAASWPSSIYRHSLGWEVTILYRLNIESAAVAAAYFDGKEDEFDDEGLMVISTECWTSSWY